MPQNDEPKRTTGMPTGLTVTFAVLTALLLLVAITALWFGRNIFNQERFTQTTTQAIQQESSRQAIATQLTSRLFDSRPLLARVAQQPAVNIISGALGSDLAGQVFGRAVGGLQAIATSPDPQDVTLDLSGFKQIAASIVQIFGTQQNEPAVSDQEIPNTITIVDADRVPNIYNLGVILLWVGPLALVIALALFAYSLIHARKNWRQFANALGVYAVAIVAVGLLALAAGPLLKPMVLSGVQSSNMRIVAENLYTAFEGTFNGQVTWLFVIAGVLLLLAAVVWTYPYMGDWVRRRAKKA